MQVRAPSHMVIEAHLMCVVHLHLYPDNYNVTQSWQGLEVPNGSLVPRLSAHTQTTQNFEAESLGYHGT